jgi:isopentenyl-diphosphate Delta-isomerase
LPDRLEQVILVDEHDREVGVGEKLLAHRAGALHRAFSVFVFDRRGRLLLQRRARGKYHSGGLWSNTCCGHPRPGETTGAAARRRLREEMNFECELREAYSFLYRVEFGNRLVEHEYDHVLVGRFDGEPAPDASEVEAWRWVSVEKLEADVIANPDTYSYWLRLAVGADEWRGLGADSPAAGQERVGVTGEPAPRPESRPLGPRAGVELK